MDLDPWTRRNYSQSFSQDNQNSYNNDNNNCYFLDSSAVPNNNAGMCCCDGNYTMRPPPAPPPPQQPPHGYPQAHLSLQSSNGVDKLIAPFRNNFMYFKPQQAQPIRAPSQSDSQWSWCNSELQKLMLDDAMYFGRQEYYENVPTDPGSAPGAGRTTSGCQAGWMPQSEFTWAADDSVLRYPYSVHGPQRVGFSSNYNQRQLLPDI